MLAALYLPRLVTETKRDWTGFLEHGPDTGDTEQDYETFEAISCLAEIKCQEAVQPLTILASVNIAKDDRERWMSIRALGLLRTAKVMPFPDSLSAYNIYMRPTGTAAELERRRHRVVQLVEAGESPRLVARILGVDPSSIHRWRRPARPAGHLSRRPVPGRPRRWSDAQLQRLETLLKQGATLHGWANALWTAKRVAVLMRRHCGVRYHPEHVRKLLRQRLHWTSQKPQKHARERTDKEVERWIADEWPRIIRAAFRRRAHLARLDESGFMLAPLVRRPLAPRGQTPILDCSDSHDRISVISAITLSPQAWRVGLHFMLLSKNQNCHGEEVVLFWRQLKGALGGPWTGVWDRHQIHRKARVVKAWWANHPEVVVEDFPAHAPNANPDEEVWCWTKYGVLCNLAPADVAERREHIWNALTMLKHQPQLLVSFILQARVPLLFRKRVTLSKI